MRLGILFLWGEERDIYCTVQSNEMGIYPLMVGREYTLSNEICTVYVGVSYFCKGGEREIRSQIRYEYLLLGGMVELPCQMRYTDSLIVRKEKKNEIEIFLYCGERGDTLSK